MTDLGCFGMPSTYNAASIICQRCPFFVPCGKSAQAILAALRGGITADRMLESLTPPRVVLQPTQSHITRIHAAPIKVQPRLERLLNDGFDQKAAEAFANGRNPFPLSGSKQMHQAGQMLLQGGFTRHQLRDWCIETMGWSKASAASQVSNDVALLRSLALVEESDAGRLILHRQISKVQITL